MSGLSKLVKFTAALMAISSAVILIMFPIYFDLETDVQLLFQVISLILFISSILLIFLSSYIDLNKWQNTETCRTYKVLYNYGITSRLNNIIYFITYYLSIFIVIISGKFDELNFIIIIYPLLLFTFSDSLSFMKNTEKIYRQPSSATRSGYISKFEYTRHYRYNLLQLVDENDPHENNFNNKIEKYYGIMYWSNTVLVIIFLIFEGMMV